MLDLRTVSPDAPPRVIIGAGQQARSGWIATQGDELNLPRRDQWRDTSGERRADALLCEHVWEHPTEVEEREAARLCHDFLKPDGYLRCAVPDANFRDESYRWAVQDEAHRTIRDHSVAPTQRRTIGGSRRTSPVS